MIHHTLSILETGQASETDSFILESLDQATSAIIFVHGFAGSALGTWAGFPRKLTTRVPKTDVYFYGYDSWAAQANVHAEAFRLFVDERMQVKKYREVLMVGHSLGALVIRRALLNAHACQNDWRKQVNIMFFAPAHMGATNIIELGLTVVETLPKLGRAVMGALGHFAEGFGDAIGALGPAVSGYGGVTLSKSLRDLERGSETLQQIREDTEAVMQSGQEPDCFVTAKKIIFGFGEDIVDTNRFLKDPVAVYLHPSGLGNTRSRYIPAVDHIDVCKPREDYPDPINLVVGVIDQMRPRAAEPPLRNLDPTLLSPDPSGLRKHVVAWLDAHTETEHKRVFRYHDKAVTVPEEIKLRAGLDLLIDLASVAELACFAGVLQKTDIPAKLMYWLSRLAEPGVQPYYTDYYPSPLIKPFLDRVDSGIATSDTREAFMGFWALQARISTQKSIRNFLGVLDDLGIQDEELGWIYWPEIAKIIEDPRGLSATLMAPGRSERVQAVRGYRAFLYFCLDFYNYRNDCVNPQAAAVATEAWYHFRYWFKLFNEKFKYTVAKQSDFISGVLGASHPAVEEVKTAELLRIIDELAAGPREAHPGRPAGFFEEVREQFERMLGAGHPAGAGH